MHWFAAAFGLIMITLNVAFILNVNKPMTVTTTDLQGHETVEYRRLRPIERVFFGLFCAGFAAVGGLILCDSVQWLDDRVPEERLGKLLGVLALVGALGSVSAVAWYQAVQGRRVGLGEALVDDDDDVDDPNDVAVGLVIRLLLSHPIGAALLGLASGGAAVLCVSQVAGVWRGDTRLLDRVPELFQPLNLIGRLIGLSEVSVALILLGLWLIIALLKNNGLGAALTVMLAGLYGLIALVAWPLGFLDEWLGFGRSVLSIL